METVLYKQAGNVPLYADIYYRPENEQSKRPVALLIHGGGHCLFSRKNANQNQVSLLQSRGIIAVSVDYRLCPEVNLLEGPMTDVRDALKWVRETLPTVKLDCPGLKVDGHRVAAIGWSTGGTLAMSLGFTSQLFGIKPPEAILAFYCPSNYNDEFFKLPTYPNCSIDSPDNDYDLLDSVRDEPFTSYMPPLDKGEPGPSRMSLADPRWRIILHMFWKAQSLPVLINGLPSKRKLAAHPMEDAEHFETLPMPSKDQITSISPYDQIQLGNYRTPTYLVHGTGDDLISHEQSRITIDALRKIGVGCGIANPVGAKHLFDMFPSEDPMGTGAEAVRQGYEFLFTQLGL